ncbi:MAG: bifunctional phosphopantothenoylcysteine decarboxylase/phosphopantothenate--cysteine ligase CoaBC [Thermodesulfobacteriota bacterium]
MKSPSDSGMKFSGKNILLGVTGGISAYKSAELVRLLKKQGADVHVVMTGAAQQFVGWTTFGVLSENPVFTDLFSPGMRGVAHIELAGNADVAVIAPATANIIAKLACGIADDALSTTMLAVTAPVVLCPAMNTSMYENRRVNRNIDILEQDGFHILEPEEGELACKTSGPGRLPEPRFILDRIDALLQKKDLKSRRILVTAGPTREPIDPVRYISNHSSGKMGYAVAEAAEKRGANVTLVTGPVCIDPPFNVETVSVETCEEMERAVLSNMEDADIIIKVAAVGDYKPSERADSKLKKNRGAPLVKLDLAENRDILQLVGENKREEQFLVGFAAETDDLEKNALLKLEKKNLDMIVANTVGVEGTGFGADTNKAGFFFKDGSSEDVPAMEKIELAGMILDRVAERIG